MGSPLQIYPAVGQALTVWEAFESWQQYLYLTCIQTRAEAASRSYGMIDTARRRRDVLQVAGQTCFRQYRWRRTIRTASGD
jgi:hypothetical protein